MAAYNSVPNWAITPTPYAAACLISGWVSHTYPSMLFRKYSWYFTECWNDKGQYLFRWIHVNFKNVRIMVNWTLMNSIPTIQEIELESSLTYKRYITPCIKNLKYHNYLQVRSAPTHRPRYIVPTACLEPVAPRTVILHNVSICTLFKYILLLRHSKILKALKYRDRHVLRHKYTSFTAAHS